MARTIDQYTADLRNQLPEPGDTAHQRLRHTVAVHANTADHDLAVLATGGVYDGPGVDGRGNTGITYGDLRLILDWLDRSEAHLNPDHPAFQS